MKTRMLLLISLIMCFNLKSQNYKEQGAVWLAYTGVYKFSGHWGMHLEAQIREDDQVKLSRQNLFRAGLVYFINAKVNVAAGYGLINTYSSSMNSYFGENRAWEQLIYTLSWSEKKNAMINRVRVEQRFVDHLVKLNGASQVDKIYYQNRIRYLNRNTFTLFESKALHGPFYILLQDEVFINVGENEINKNAIDQNRFMVGFGFHYNSNTRFELAYLNHFVNPYKSVATMNHTFQIGITHNLDFYQKKE